MNEDDFIVISDGDALTLILVDLTTSLHLEGVVSVIEFFEKCNAVARSASRPL